MSVRSRIRGSSTVYRKSIRKLISTKPMAMMRHQALEHHVLAGDDGVAELVADARDVEEVLDHDRAADERADVEAGDREQREARRPQGVAPQDAAVGDALGLGHEDEVLLQRGTMSVRRSRM